MEYVDGTPLTTYCNAHCLSVADRLELFVQVGEAVEHAHQTQVVHRDLKPSNVLVTDAPAPAPQVKLLDFGIAKLLEGEDEGLTRTGAALMTPAYAAPEQIVADAVTPATDVYALGVLLYELLAGRLPHAVASPLTPQSMQTILTSVPTPPSTASGQPADGADRAPARPATGTAQDVAAARSTTPRGLYRQLQGDLDVIVMTALRKEPERRYDSAGAMVEDVRRFLRGEPVRARGDRLAYRLQKFAARNQRFAGAVAAVLVALLVGLGMAVWQAGVAADARQRAERSLADAERELAQSEAALQFLEGVFSGATPDETVGGEPTASDLLEDGAGDLASVSQPDVKARLLSVIGTSYRSLGRLQRAESLQVASVALRRQRVQQDTSRALRRGLARSLQALGATRIQQGRFADAETLLREALQINRAVLPETDPARLSTLGALGIALSKQGRFRDALELERTEVRRLRSRVAAGDADTLDLAAAVNNLSVTLQRQGGHGEALRLARKAVHLLDERFGSTPRVDRSYVYTNLALAYNGAARPREGLPHARAARAMRAALVDSLHPLRAIAPHNVAELLFYAGRLAEAEAESRRAQRRMKAAHGERHPGVADVRHTYGQILRAQGELDRAVRVLRQTEALRRDLLGDDHIRVAKTLVARAQVHLDRGEWRKGGTALREANRIHDARFPRQTPFGAVIDAYHAETLVRMGRTDEAVPRLRSAYDDLMSAQGQERVKALRVAGVLADVLAGGDPEAADRWAAHGVRPDTLPPAMPLDVID
jgi:serine/threonine-protein kinase